MQLSFLRIIRLTFCGCVSDHMGNDGPRRRADHRKSVVFMKSLRIHEYVLAASAYLMVSAGSAVLFSAVVINFRDTAKRRNIRAPNFFRRTPRKLLNSIIDFLLFYFASIETRGKKGNASLSHGPETKGVLFPPDDGTNKIIVCRREERNGYTKFTAAYELLNIDVFNSSEWFISLNEKDRVTIHTRIYRCFFFYFSLVKDFMVVNLISWT